MKGTKGVFKWPNKDFPKGSSSYSSDGQMRGDIQCRCGTVLHEVCKTAYVYKRSHTDRTDYFCSYHCMRAYDREQEQLKAQKKAQKEVLKAQKQVMKAGVVNG